MLDFDNGHRPNEARLLRILSGLQLRAKGPLKYHQTRRGWHVTIELTQVLTAGEIIAAQFALGSDVRRERYNLMRVICGGRLRDVNLLFDAKL